jgi:hypothetical protein
MRRALVPWPESNKSTNPYLMGLRLVLDSSSTHISTYIFVRGGGSILVHATRVREGRGFSSDILGADPTPGLAQKLSSGYTLRHGKAHRSVDSRRFE